MNKIEWCKKKKNGLELIASNNNLAIAYLKKAEESLESMRENITKDWKISTAYYTVYFSLYSLLMKIGIKCEIHSCTIEFAKTFLSDFFKKSELDFFEDSLKARIDSQYYINRTISNEQYEKMIQDAPKILVKCKNVLIKLNEKKIKEIRDKFTEGVKKQQWKEVYYFYYLVYSC